MPTLTDPEAAACDPLGTPAWNAALETAARHIESILDKRVQDTWSYDPTTNAWEAPDSAAEAADIEGREMADAVRSLKAAPIASATDLLAALRDAVAYMNGYGMSDAEQPILDAARAAIAKAEGRA